MAAVVAVACSPADNEDRDGRYSSREITVDGDVSTGNVLQGLILAIDSGRKEQVTEIAPTLSEADLRRLASSDRCTPWKIAAVENNVMISRGCPCGNVGKSEGFYFSVERAKVATMRVDQKHEVEC